MRRKKKKLCPKSVSVATAFNILFPERHLKSNVVLFSTKTNSCHTELRAESRAHGVKGD